MKRLMPLALVLSITWGCGLGGSSKVAQILNDARWGLMAGCASTWVPPDACTIGFDALTLADGIVASHPGNTGPAVRQLLVDVEARLPVDSRLRPYLDAIIILLAP